MNKVFLIGRLTKDPEIRMTTTGKKVASFSIAVNEGKDASGQELVQFFNLTAWDKLADIIESYVKKGTKIAAIGKLQNRSWDKPDGTKAYATDVVLREMEILSSKMDAQPGEAMAPSNDSSNQSSSAKKPSKSAKDEDAEDDDLPEIDIDSVNVQMPF